MATKTLTDLGVAGAIVAADLLLIRQTGADKKIAYSDLKNGPTPRIQRLAAQFDKTNTTLADITGLSYTLTAGKTYRFRAVLHAAITAAGGGKAAIAGTATATAIRYTGKIIGTTAGATALASASALGTAVSFNNGADTVCLIEIEGTIVVNAGGTLLPQFAQQASSGTSSVLIGSTWEIEELL